MPDREKVIKALECCTSEKGKCGECPRFTSASIQCVLPLMRDALVLLKEQEPDRSHGHWLHGNKSQPCSVCHHKGKKSWDYCPVCGAIMDEEAVNAGP